ncbi:hypothetical protein SYNPS1DRAFT_32015 [Syncephalis pseudoplumigaleata]|uniref:Uncharacterized protein n=1 Tax=Syncephalis pseudoplumigaleata TaxID=1712513 RepID=A0A4P9YRN6_9FUNG|nr:hypothetical protein SYNPS1DRAFT_32015 [Syncephalis pseudoplumigaleata]|eukprot:RKP22394.1 hypothetical protein SYNPS1DRAFT_32015 [Syncephalis pseudoplumigaleata]
MHHHKREDGAESSSNGSDLLVAPAPLEPHVALLEQLDEQIDRLARGLPTGTGLIVLSGHGDTRDAVRLGAKRRRANEYSQRASTADDTARPAECTFSEMDLESLRTAVAKARMGIAMFTAR